MKQETQDLRKALTPKREEKQAMVWRELVRLDETVIDLRFKVNALVERLEGSVLAPAVEASDEKTKIPREDSGVPLVRRIAQAEEALRETSECVEAALERLEV